MNGAQILIQTLADREVDVCFTNPGTSEMHIVAALDDVPKMRAVLCLYEGVASGAADGYGRMAGKPGCTLLHLGPGLANALANFHNARRARTPVVNVVGDHALSHKRLDTPLESDIDALAGTVSGWTRRTYRSADVASDATQAVAKASGPPGRIATLIVPADVSWSDAVKPSPPNVPALMRAAARGMSPEAVAVAAEALRSGEPAALLLGGAAEHGPAMRAAARIAGATGAKLYCQSFPARLERGAGRPPVKRLPYFPSDVAAELAGLRHLVLADAADPAPFFAYPGLSSRLAPDGCAVSRLADETEDVTAALEALADEVCTLAKKPVTALAQEAGRPTRPTGALTAESVASAIGALLPENSIVVDETNTSGIWLAAATAGCPPHDWLTLTGGSMGQGLPTAVGAAMACPDRPVFALEGDGSAMYTLQALWTMAREGLNVTTVLFDNGAYAILDLELQTAAGPEGGRRGHELIDISRPALDFLALARGLGVPAQRVRTAEEFTAALEHSLMEPGPMLIDCAVPSVASAARTPGVQ
ncbi:acetolactate synthase large subunit [Streptomyces kunmingensis]|uniref:Acetolactate synthase large subunit n=1 Tax=Streptomyces kunmingensis TaxID=68225 RepID=A0ABU6CRS5_9ACTN|nr:acetolactate synthase large subunit [Streptomyces kunmingensis]MEB3967159.1 acetolactate synthase large subunit [Streptomyces kunmingensis]